MKVPKVPIIDINTGKVIKQLEKEKKQRKNTSIEYQIGEILADVFKQSKAAIDRYVKDIMEDNMTSLDILELVDWRPVDTKKLISLLAQNDKKRGYDDWVIINKSLAPQLYGSVYDIGDMFFVCIYDTKKFLFLAEIECDGYEFSKYVYVNKINGQLIAGDEGGGVVLFSYKGKEAYFRW